MNESSSSPRRKPRPAPIPILSLDNPSPGTSPTRSLGEGDSNNTDKVGSLNSTPSSNTTCALLDPDMVRNSRSPSPTRSSNKRATWYGGDVNLSGIATPLRPPSPIKGHYNPPRSVSPVRSPINNSVNGSSPAAAKNPFNFESTTFTPVSGGVGGGANAPSKRRGHKYKHSSVSINFFQEPPPRNPLPIPASLPIPTVRECYQSMSKEQTIRLSWCMVHLIAAGLVYNSHQSLMALSALAHLLFYDAMGALVCCIVDILSNFSVWHQSSIRHPFGLERIQVLAGFALSVSLVFMGGDIMAHSIQVFLQGVYGDEGGHGHHHGNHHEGEEGQVSSMVACVLFGIVVTIISAVGLENHSRISKTMQHHVNLFSLADTNPSHFLTITFSIAVIMIPTLLSSHAVIVDSVLTPLMAFGMCYVGWALAKILSGMLVMSYSGPNTTPVIQTELKADPCVSEVWDVSFWQVQHHLWLASMKISITGPEENETRVRMAAEDAIRNIMEVDYGAARWESTIDIINLSQRK